MTPLEWVDELDKRLSARQPAITRYNSYYDGNQPLLFASEKFRKAFGGLFTEFSDNWCAPVVNAVDERLAVVGFRFGEDAKADDDAWRIWQSNHMDAESKLGIKASLVDARSFIMVWPTDDETTPRMTVESASQMIVAYAPGDRYTRAAALKRWTDEWSGEIFATLYLPEAVYKFKAKEADKERIVPKATTTPGEGWQKRTVGKEDWPLKNPIGEVPVVEIANDPRLAREPRSELESVIPLQDAVNKLVTDMMVASEYGAFRQKWATGIEIPTDPITGQEIEAFRIAVESFVHAPPAETGEEPARFGEFGQTDLSNFETGINLLVSHIASQTRTPPHYLNTSADRLSGESLKSSETGLICKARDHQLHKGEGIEEAQRLAFRFMGDPRADFVGAEVVWKDPETRSEAEHMDALVKKMAIGVPMEQLWEDAGYTPQQIKRFKAMHAEQALLMPAPSPDEEAEPEPAAPAA